MHLIGFYEGYDKPLRIRVIDAIDIFHKCVLFVRIAKSDDICARF